MVSTPNEMPRQNWDEEYIEDPSRQRNEALKNSRSQQRDLKRDVEKTQPSAPVRFAEAPAPKPTEFAAAPKPEEATRNPAEVKETVQSPLMQLIDELRTNDTLTKDDLKKINALHEKEQKANAVRSPFQSKNGPTFGFNHALYDTFTKALEANLGENSQWHTDNPDSPYVKAGFWAGNFKLVEPKKVATKPTKPDVQKPERETALLYETIKERLAEVIAKLTKGTTIADADIKTINDLHREAQKATLQRTTIYFSQNPNIASRGVGTGPESLTTNWNEKTYNEFKENLIKELGEKSPWHNADKNRPYIEGQRNSGGFKLVKPATPEKERTTPPSTPERPVVKNVETQKLSTDDQLDALVQELCGKAVLTKADVKKINDLYFKYKTEHGAYARGSKFPPNLAVAEKFRNDIEQAVGEANRPDKNYITYGKGGVFSRDFQLVERKNK